MSEPFFKKLPKVYPEDELLKKTLDEIVSGGYKLTSVYYLDLDVTNPSSNAITMTFVKPEK